MLLGDKMSYRTTSYESFYSGSPSALSPEYGAFGSFGYRMNAGQVGYSINPATGDQLGEVVKTLKGGVKAVEVQLLGMQDADQMIPKQHFKEMRALMKLSGVKPSVHGPLIDAAGFGEKGWTGEEGREDNERKMFQAIERAHELGPKGNIPIVFHAANGTPGAEFRPGDVEKGEKRFKEYIAPVVDAETGQVSQVKEHRTYYLSTKKKDFEKGGTLMTTKQAIDNRNATEWDEKLKEVALGKKYGDEALQTALARAEGLNLTNIDTSSREGIKTFEEELGKNPEVYNDFNKASTILDNNNTSFRSLFHSAYKFGSEAQKKELQKLSQNWKEDQKNIERGSKNSFQEQISASALQDKYFGKFKEITSPRGKIVEGKIVRDKNYGAPELFQSAEKFAMGKAADTFSNLALKSYKKFKDNAPVIAVENMYQGMGFSRSKDLKKLVEKSREEFAKKLVKEKGFSKGKAEQIAEKQLGVTWDVGHLNMLKKTGFSEKDLVEETKKIAPLVKHVHLTDNFGYSDSHLAPGMGNVPFKKILKELEKTGRLGEMRKVIEAGGFVNTFKRSAVPWTMQAMGSPIYGMHTGPTWNQAEIPGGGYFGGYGTLNPQQHHSIYGAGFTTMPVELGGEMQGGQSRFGGAPMA